MAEPTLIELIELHERKWGERKYPGRPGLAELMSYPIVAVWRVGKRFVLSAHKEADELNALVFSIVTGKDSDLLDRRLLKVYFEKRAIPFTVKIVSTPEQASKPIEQQKHEEKSQDKFIFQRRLNTGGIPAAPAPRTTPVVASINPMPKGTPAYLDPKPHDPNMTPLTRQPEIVPLDNQLPLIPFDPNAKPGRNTHLVPGRQVEWLQGREVQILRTLDPLLQELKPPIKQARIYKGEKR